MVTRKLFSVQSVRLGMGTIASSDAATGDEKGHVYVRLLADRQDDFNGTLYLEILDVDQFVVGQKYLLDLTPAD